MVEREPPQTGRAGRRERRETARKLAREIMQTSNRREQSPKVDVALWFLAAFMALGLLLVAPKIGRGVTAVVIVGMAGCLAHPLWQLRLVQRAPSPRERAYRFAGMMSTALGALMAFGVFVWPPVTRHHLSQREWNRFEKPLRVQQKGEHEEIQIVCPAADEPTCVYAEQFINIFRDAGWKVQNNEVQRVTLARPPAGVMLYKHSDGTPDPNDWRSGAWTRVSPGLVSVYQAFASIGIEPDEESRKDIAEEVMTIYFGTAKADEGEPTNLTQTMERNKGYKIPGKL